MSRPAPPPALWWDPGALQRAKPLTEEGLLPGAPFPDLPAALAAAHARRTTPGPRSRADHVFLVVFEPSGWMAYEYSERRWGRADLDELLVRGLPLGGSVEAPRTFVIDGRGRVGRIVAGETVGAYAVEPVDPAAPAATPPPTYLPAFVPDRVVNHARNVRWTPRVSLRPGPDAGQLADALAWLDRHLAADVTVRAGGSRHSWSPVAGTDGVYIHPEGMRGVEPEPAAPSAGALVRDGVDVSHLWRVRSGTTIRTLNHVLWEAGQALAALGGYDGQTLGGVLPTGTHGSVFRRGPLAEMVRSLDLIRFDGSAVRIESADAPLTDPQRFAAARPDWQLVQDNDEFDAVLIGLGAMGVVHTFVVEAVDRFWLKEVRTLTTMTEAVDALRGQNLYHLMEVPTPAGVGPPDARSLAGHPKPAYHLELLWNPYTDRTVVTSRHPVDADRRRELETQEPEYFARPPVRDLRRALRLDAMADEYSRPDLTELGTELLRDVLDDALETVVHLIPRAVPGFIDNALEGMPDEAFIQRSYHVFNVGDGANRIPAQSGTISLPIRDDLWLRGIDVLRATARALAADERKYQTGPISLRFVRGSRILLADTEDVCKFEIIFGGDDDRIQALSRDLMKAYDDALRAAFGADVRLHWGQIIPDGAMDAGGERGGRVRENYPRYDDWRRIRDAHDPGGRGLTPWLRSVLPD